MSKRWLSSGVLVIGMAVSGTVGWAETPKDTVVIAKQIDDIISLDPGECYESGCLRFSTCPTTGSCATSPRICRRWSAA